MNTTQNIRFRMNKIIVQQFAILSDNSPCVPEMQLNTQIEFQLDKEHKLIACDAKFWMEDETEKPLLKLDIQCQFMISPEDWDAQKQADESVLLPKGFLAHLAVHTVGTARGVLHCKTESTPFNTFIIPPINVEKMISEDIVVKK